MIIFTACHYQVSAQMYYIVGLFSQTNAAMLHTFEGKIVTQTAERDEKKAQTSIRYQIPISILE